MLTTKPTGGGTPLASIEIGTKQPPAWQILFSAPLVINGGGEQEEDVQTQTLGDRFSSRDDQDACW